MPDNPFNPPRQGGDYWKPADHDDHVLVFLYAQEQQGLNTFGNEYAKAEGILCLDCGDSWEHDQAEISQAALKGQVAGAGVVLGRLGHITTKAGREAWSLHEVTDAKVVKAAQATFIKICSQDDQGHWTITSKPDEAPF
jgi:hypothetical protein